MNRKIVKSRVSQKRYKKPSFERVVIDRKNNDKNKKVFKPKTVKVVEKSEDIKRLLEAGFEFVCQKDNLIFLRKRK